MKIQKKWKKNLLSWFEKQKRDLPWRGEKDPYRIWISEVMLQQTTSQAVIPYYKAFLKTFPNLAALASASEKELHFAWSGLGYYSRVRNLKRAAQEIKKLSYFPKTHKELLPLSGFGPYTARAVSSLAFGESVGVLDGNVIRFLCRFHGLSLKWWKSAERDILQKQADAWVQKENPSQMNQALMEQGSLICSRKPLCFLCHMRKDCQAFEKNKQELLPLKKKKKEVQIIQWRPCLLKKKDEYAFVKNTQLPFLKNHLIFPGNHKTLKKKPKNYDLSHSITHYKIYIQVDGKKRGVKPSQLIWLKEKNISRHTPSSLIQKILKKQKQGV